MDATLKLRSKLPGGRFCFMPLWEKGGDGFETSLKHGACIQKNNKFPDRVDAGAGLAQNESIHFST